MRPRYPNSKYKAVPTVVDGIRFASKAEARRWSELLLLQRAGKIEGLMRQRVFPLHAPVEGGSGKAWVGSYIADFCFYENGKFVVEDVKSEATKKIPLYQRNKRHLAAEYGLSIREVP